jgi:UrcA family protein
MSLAACAAAAFIAFATTRAFAGETATSTRVVHYGDLDLATADGVATLESRIAAAAGSACGPLDGRTLADRGRWDACRTAAIAAAQPKVQTALASAGSSVMQSASARSGTTALH